LPAATYLERTEPEWFKYDYGTTSVKLRQQAVTIGEAWPDSKITIELGRKLGLTEAFLNEDVIYVKPDRTVAQVKEILRLKRISGVPVVDDNNIVVGIISIEDIIKCLENGTLNESVNEHMTKNVVCLSEDATLQDVIKHFERYRYGRFPVVDAQGKLVGIVTKNDILAAVATRLGLLYLHDERRREILDQDV